MNYFRIMFGMSTVTSKATEFPDVQAPQEDPVSQLPPYEFPVDRALQSCTPTFSATWGPWKGEEFSSVWLKNYFKKSLYFNSIPMDKICEFFRTGPDEWASPTVGFWTQGPADVWWAPQDFWSQEGEQYNVPLSVSVWPVDIQWLENVVGAVSPNDSMTPQKKLTSRPSAKEYPWF